MDKQTLSHYGWIVVMILTLSVMLALGTPLGRYIGRGVSNIAISFVGANDNAVDSDNIENMEDYWEDYLGSGGANENVEINENGFVEGVFYVAPMTNGENEYLTGFTLLDDGTIVFVESYYGLDGLRIEEQYLTPGFDLMNDLFYSGECQYQVYEMSKIIVPDMEMGLQFSDDGKSVIVYDYNGTTTYNLDTSKEYVPFEFNKKYQYVMTAEIDGVKYEQYFTANEDYTGEFYSTDYGTSTITKINIRNSDGFTKVFHAGDNPNAPSLEYIMVSVTGYWYCSVIG